MDVLELVIEDDGPFWPRSAVIYVNGRRLYDLAREAASEPDQEWVAPPPGSYYLPRGTCLEAMTSGKTLVSPSLPRVGWRWERAAVRSLGATPSW